MADSPECLFVVRSWLVAKLENQAAFLADLKRKRPNTQLPFDQAVTQIFKARDHLNGLQGSVPVLRNQMMGIEGAASARYFGVIGKLPPKAFAFTSRSQRPARDPVNACLNYGYGILYSMVDRSCILAGLDPFVGFLHTDNYNKTSLVFDLIEPFRIWVDRVVLHLFTGRKMKQEYFESTANGVVLSKEVRGLLVQELNAYLDKKIDTAIKSATSSKRKRRIRRRDAIQAEAHTLANRLLGRDGGLPEIIETRELFAEPKDT